MGTEEGKSKLEKDKGNASACFMWELTACQDSFYLCCHGGRTQCLALPETLAKVYKNTCSAIKLCYSSCVGRFYLDIIAYALSFAHQKKCAVIYQRKIGVEKSGAHHCKATGHGGLLRRAHTHRELGKKLHVILLLKI